MMLLLVPVLACVKSDAEPDEPGLDSQTCELTSDIVCSVACTCDACELTVDAAPMSFVDSPTCKVVLFERCDSSVATDEDAIACTSMLVDALVEYTSSAAAEDCAGILSLPGECEPFFSE